MNLLIEDRRQYLHESPHYEDYVKMGDSCVEAFPRDYKEEFEIFTGFDQEFIGIIEHIRSRPELFPSRKHAEVLLKLSAVTHRQFRNSFYLMMRHQSYDSFALVRKSIEASTHAFRIFKKPSLVSIYLAVDKGAADWRRSQEWKAFEKEFLEAELPRDIPSREGIKGFISEIINANFSHPDKNFIAYSVDKSDGRSDFSYFDAAGDSFFLQLVSFLVHHHNCTDIWRAILGESLPIKMQSPNSSWEQIDQKYQRYWRFKQQLLDKYLG